MQSVWDALVRSRRFWVGFLSASVSLAQCPSLLADSPGDAGRDRFDLVERVSLGFMLSRRDPDDYWVVALEISLGGEHFLSLRGKGRPQVEWGRWDCHCVPDALRHEELEALARAVAQRHPPLWAARLLFSPYVPLEAGSRGPVLAAVRADLEESGHFTAAEVEYVLGRMAKGTARDVRWVPHDEMGWVAEGADAMSFRVRGARQFVAVREFFAALEGQAEQEAPPDRGGV